MSNPQRNQSQMLLLHIQKKSYSTSKISLFHNYRSTPVGPYFKTDGDHHKTFEGCDIARQFISENGFDVLDENGKITINKRPTNISHQVPLTVRFGANQYMDCIVNDVPVTKKVYIPDSTPYDAAARTGSKGEHMTVNGRITKFPKGSAVTHPNGNLTINGELFTDAMFTD